MCNIIDRKILVQIKFFKINMPQASMRSRRGPLHACGVSTLAIALSLYKKAIELNGPIGSVTRRVAKLGSKVVNRPLVNYMVLYPWLALLFVVDDLIISIEKRLETQFPTLRHIFNKIDNLVDKIENFSKELEHAMGNFTKNAEEKEIKVDTNSNTNEQRNENNLASPIQDVVNTKNNALTIGANEELNEDSPLLVDDSTLLKSLYKETLEKGVKENMKFEENSQGVEKDVKENNVAKDYVNEAMMKQDVQQQSEETKNEIKTMTKDEPPLLEIFDFGWEIPKPKKVSH
ncbi:uncharacterized protein [Spinacia oleracea]|uniref:Uncharacterized protein isoform X2 n=1 Tax=Spinacia oleracea TaxID=3562 RepID=A0ABM3QSS0_SPIOL|nr:uncharacterized protein LOC130462065 isoform X2 [Spinacia oleracea]